MKYTSDQLFYAMFTQCLLNIDDFPLYAVSVGYCRLASFNGLDLNALKL